MTLGCGEQHGRRLLYHSGVVLPGERPCPHTRYQH
jgi:hypothetical protein